MRDIPPEEIVEATKEQTLTINIENIRSISPTASL